MRVNHSFLCFTEKFLCGSDDSPRIHDLKRTSLDSTRRLSPEYALKVAAKASGSSEECSLEPRPHPRMRPQVEVHTREQAFCRCRGSDDVRKFAGCLSYGALLGQAASSRPTPPLPDGRIRMRPCARTHVRAPGLMLPVSCARSHASGQHGLPKKVHF